MAISSLYTFINFLIVVLFNDPKYLGSNLGVFDKVTRGNDTTLGLLDKLLWILDLLLPAILEFFFPFIFELTERAFGLCLVSSTADLVATP